MSNAVERTRRAGLRSESTRVQDIGDLRAVWIEWCVYEGNF